MKKKEYYEVAQRLYIEKLYTYQMLAKELPVTLRTLTRWGKEGCWADKQAMYKKTNSELFSDSLSIVKALGVRFLALLKEGKEVPNNIYGPYCRLLPFVKTEEKQVTEIEENSEVKKTAEQILNEILKQ